MNPRPAADYEHIAINETDRTERGKTARYSVVNRKHGADLGEIRWYGVWRQYILEPLPRALFSAGCLQDIASFIEQATAAQRSDRPRPWQDTA